MQKLESNYLKSLNPIEKQPTEKTNVRPNADVLQKLESNYLKSLNPIEKQPTEKTNVRPNADVQH